MAVDFEASSNQKLATSSSPSAIDNVIQSSMVCAIKLESFGDGGHGTIFGKHDGGDTGWKWAVDNKGGDRANTIAYWMDVPTNGFWDADNAPIQNLGQWYWVGVTYDRGSDSNDPVFWVDGEKYAAVATFGSPSGVGSTNDSGAVATLGASNQNPNNRDFDGLIAYFRWWDEILSDEEMALLTSGYLGPVRNPIMNVTLDDFQGVDAIQGGEPLGSGENAVDLGPSALHMAPTNTPTAQPFDGPFIRPWQPWHTPSIDPNVTMTPDPITFVGATAIGATRNIFGPSAAAAVAAVAGPNIIFTVTPQAVSAVAITQSGTIDITHLVMMTFKERKTLLTFGERDTQVTFKDRKSPLTFGERDTEVTFKDRKTLLTFGDRHDG